MAFSPAALFRRDTVKDPFGGDDMDDGESRFAGKGPKIALAASGLLFVLLIGGVAAIVMTGDKNVAPPVTGSFADLQVEEDTTVPAAATPANAAATPAVVADSTAATDRSVERRPWLADTNNATAPRPGVADASKPAAPAAAKSGVTPPPAPVATAAVPPAPAKPADVKPADVKAVDIKAADAKAPVPAAIPPAPAAKPTETKTAVMTPPPATAPTTVAMEPKSISLNEPARTPTTTPAPATGKAPTPLMPASLPDADENNPAREIAGIPALQASGQAPGAPRLFDLPKGTDVGPNVAGGRPRLVEPPLPPTDKIAVSAPPPRYANLTDVKHDAGTPAPAATAMKVAFVINGLGLNQGATDAAINKLPAAVTLSFSPYARDLKKWMDKAKEKGHEVLIEVPMESKQFPADDPGPLGLLTSAEPKENQDRLETILKNANGAVGVLDTTGSKFRESSEFINPVFAKLKQSNLFYVQGMPGVRVGEATVPTAVADLVADERPFRADIDARLDYAERLAKYQGSAVVAMSAKPVGFERLVLWLDQAQKKGISLAPVSQVLIKQ